MFLAILRVRSRRLKVDSDEYYIHDELVEKAKRKLKGLGYKIYDNRYDYNDFSVEEVNAFEYKSPDIIAKKNGELLAVEVKAKPDKLIEQLENYAKGGKVILLLGLKDVSNIELWSVKQLEMSS